MEKVFVRVAWRIVPFAMLLYVVSFLDRVNIGFAALTMRADLGISAEAFGFASGIFFLGYCAFELPSNLILARVGARRWICRIMLTWGAISMAMAFAHDIYSLVALRFLLGVAEAGLFPGMIVYFTYWFPSKMRARFMALLVGASPFANVIGAPLSGFLLNMDGMGGLHGWQWLFVIEGAPACLLAFVVLKWLPDGPRDAPWLNADEAATIEARLAADPPGAHNAFLSALKDARVWVMAVPLFLAVIPLYGVTIWLPQMVRDMGLSNIQTGFTVAALYSVAIAAMIALAASSDRRHERIGHFVIGALSAALGFGLAALLHDNLLRALALTLAASGTFALVAVYWTVPQAFLRGAAAAGGIALVNAFSNLGGFFGPYLMGWLLDATGTQVAGLWMLAGCLVVSSVAMVLIGRTLGMAKPG